MRGLVIFYRVMAYVTAILLLVLCVTMTLKYGTESGTSIQGFGETWTTIIGISHGYLYLVYLAIALVVSVRLRVSIVHMLLVLLAGTVPFGAFFAERKVTHWYEEHAAVS